MSSSALRVTKVAPVLRLTAETPTRTNSLPAFVGQHLTTASMQATAAAAAATVVPLQNI